MSGWGWLAYLREELLVPLLPFAVVLRESGNLRVASVQFGPEDKQLLLGWGQFLGDLSQLRVELGNAFALGFSFGAECSVALAVDSEFVDLVHQYVVIGLSSGCLGSAFPLLCVV